VVVGTPPPRLSYGVGFLEDRPQVSDAGTYYGVPVPRMLLPSRGYFTCPPRREYGFLATYAIPQFKKIPNEGHSSCKRWLVNRPPRSALPYPNRDLISHYFDKSCHTRLRTTLILIYYHIHLDGARFNNQWFWDTS